MWDFFFLAYQVFLTHRKSIILLKMPNGPDPQILSCGIVLISTDQGLYMNMICSIMNQCLTKKEKKKKNHKRQIQKVIQ